MTTSNIPNLNLYQSSNEVGPSIKENFIVRKLEFQRIIDSIKSDVDMMSDSIQHFLFLGRRGSGKSTLLKRIEYEVQSKESLNKTFIPINLAEEQGGITRLYDVFEIVLNELTELGYDAEMIDDKAFLGDSQEVARLLFRRIHDTLALEKKRVLLLVDNIDRIFTTIGDDASVLREILLNHSDLKIIGASTKMSEHFWAYDQPFYQFFLQIKLEALSEKDTRTLLLHWSKQYHAPEIESFVDQHPAKIKIIQQLTDGLPRTLKYFVQVLIKNLDLETYNYLQGILDKISPLYQERLNRLSAGQRKIVFNLAFIWEASDSGALARKSRMKSNEASAYLKQLTDLAIVEKIETEGRNHLYRLSERFFNLWIIMTQGSPSDRRNAKYLTQFLEAWYEPDEFNFLVSRHLEKLENSDGDIVQKLHFSKALVHSQYIDEESYDRIIERSKAVAEGQECWVDFPKKYIEIKNEIIELVDQEKYDHALQLAKEINFGQGVKEGVQGFIFYRKRDIENAEKYLIKSVANGNVSAMYNLALLYNELERFEKSEQLYLRAIDNGHVGAMYNLALLYNELEGFEESEQLYLRAIDNGHVNAMYNLANLYKDLERVKESEQLYLRAIEKGDVGAMNKLANLYKEIERIEESERLYLRAIEKGDVGAMNNLAILYKDLERIKESEQLYLRAIEKGDVVALNNLAILYQVTGRIEESEQLYLRAIEKGEFRALNNLAILYREIERIEESEQLYLRAIEKGDVGAMYNLAFLYNELERLEESEQQYLRAIEKGHVGAMYNLANLYKDLERVKESEGLYLRAIEKGHVGAMYNLANLYVEIERIEESEQLYLRAIENGHVGAMNNLAILYNEIERIEESETMFRKAIEHGHINAIGALAFLMYEHNQDKFEAEVLVKKYLESGAGAKGQMLSFLINLWTGQLTNLKSSFIELLDIAEWNQIILIHLIIHHQSELALEAFTSFVNAKDIKQQNLPVYYALLEIMDDPKTKKERLKIPPEIEVTRDEIIAEIKEKRLLYYP